MGKTILSKVVPVDFMNNVLYFDAIDSFDSSNFIYLKKSKVKYASHQIDFNTDEFKQRGTNPLDLLVSQIYSKAIQRKLRFGVPYLLQENFVGRIKLSDWDKYGIKNLELDSNNLLRTNGSLPTSGGKLINVGQGLMYIDNSASIIYDCGSTLPYASIKSQLSTSLAYTIVISHWHSDHYKYLFDILRDFKVELVIVPEKILKTDTSIRLKSIIKHSGLMIHHYNGKVKGYDLIKAPSKAKQVSNTNSCILKNNDWILTGDQSTAFINKMIGAINITNFQVPHHGSGSKMHNPNKLNVKRMNNYFISVGVPSGYRNMPSTLYEAEYEKFTHLILTKTFSC